MEFFFLLAFSLPGKCVSNRQQLISLNDFHQFLLFPISSKLFEKYQFFLSHLKVVFIFQFQKLIHLIFVTINAILYLHQHFQYYFNVKLISFKLLISPFLLQIVRLKETNRSINSKYFTIDLFIIIKLPKYEFVFHLIIPIFFNFFFLQLNAILFSLISTHPQRSK